METHRDNKNYLKWSLDNTAQILQSAFSDSYIVVVRPSRMEYKTFSCFDNFVPSGNCGVPEHIPMHHSFEHLEMLLENVSNQLKDTEVTGDAKDLNRVNLRLIGFSKGCVVLNQFLYELHTLKSLALDEESRIISRIKDMYWLDGGHSGGKNTWITSKSILETLSTYGMIFFVCFIHKIIAYFSGINIHIHVSPYQIKDDRRPWIRKEEKAFYSTLTNLKAPIQRYIHSPDTLPSIYQHFNILDEFYKRHSADQSTT
ncbi:UPF0565 protein C2orf69 -like [Asbolus verrucosus]|uniref:UPF0565 protein C2orf69-like n=1 Tax=Asbolus verrucosus TaxID=1661398 RepID=A0A482VU07_ASBVE|nr:UPF0565 protein C2orf69 -like [Asbolus verrucosus]